MILYLDTSALVKLYVEEEGALHVREAVRAATVAATCEIAYVELRAAVARRHREGALRTTDCRRVLRDVNSDWPHLFLITVDSQLVRNAGAVAERYKLRAYDAVHLASSLLLQGRMRDSITFACWDGALAEAARAAQLRLLTNA